MTQELSFYKSKSQIFLALKFGHMRLLEFALEIYLEKE